MVASQSCKTPRAMMSKPRVSAADGFIERNAALLVSLQLRQSEFYEFRQHRHGDGDCPAIKQFLFQRAAVETSSF